MENGTYLRLRELAINYSLPARWVSRIPGADFRSARIGIVGRNLWTHTNYSGYDPEVTGPGGGNPFAYPVSTSYGVQDYSDRCVEMFHKMGLGALVVIGGDGTLAIAYQFYQRRIPVGFR